MEAKNHKTIHCGDWLSDTTGIYEVQEIHGSMDRVYLKEVLFVSDEGDEYTLGDWRILTRREVGHMEKEGV